MATLRHHELHRWLDNQVGVAAVALVPVTIHLVRFPSWLGGAKNRKMVE